MKLYLHMRGFHDPGLHFIVMVNYCGNYWSKTLEFGRGYDINLNFYLSCLFNHSCSYKFSTHLINLRQ